MRMMLATGSDPPSVHSVAVVGPAPTGLPPRESQGGWPILYRG
jgi:hypothetical protein